MNLNIFHKFLFQSFDTAL